jgi:PAS domain S-box-containing protein
LEKVYKILLVEDLPADAELILYELKKAKIKSEHRRVEQEEAFVQALTEFSPDIIIADFNLPRFNALRALQLINEREIIIPFILVTGTQSEEIAVDCIKSGADDYILKTSLTRLPTAFLNSIKIKRETKTRLKAEEKLKESEAHKSAILNTAADSIITIDEKGRIDLFNNAAESLFGYTEREISGKYVSLIIPDFEKADIVGELTKFTSSKKIQNGTNQAELMGRKKDGSIFFIEISVDKVELPDKSFFVTIIRDITTRKLAEEKIKYKNRELNTFVYRVSHDLKGPISSILGLIDLANYELKGHPEAIRYNKLIRQSAFKLDNTLVELLKVLHVREAEVEYSVVDVHALVHEIIRHFADLGFIENIITKVDVEKGLTFNSSKQLLSIALEKIILNSIHFRKDFSSENFILIKATRVKNQLVIEVRDNGVGIEKGIHQKVFDMFFRGNNISKGNGLGLYLTKNIAEKLNGFIELESEKDKGTLIRLIIPEPTGS